MALLALWECPVAWAEQADRPVRIGLTPAIVHDQYGLMEDWRDYLQARLGRRVVVVSRSSYRETIEMLKKGELDYAWVSSYPYVYLEHYHFARLLLTPLSHGRPYYKAYLITGADDTRTSSLAQLAGRTFAYADPYSHSGYLLPRYQLLKSGKDPATFFRRTFFTWGHKKVIEAVAEGLADAGSVDSFVWDSMKLLRPALTAQTRVVAESEDFGFPPIVVRRSVSAAESARLRRVLLDMPGDPEGARLLKRLNINGFVPGRHEWYAGVEAMMRAVGDI